MPENSAMVHLDPTPLQSVRQAVYAMAEAIDEPIDEIQCPPSNLESDEPPLETDLHRNQIDLLIRLLKYWWQDRSDFYISGNLTVYYNQQQLKSRDFRGPDIFVVLNTEKKDRRSWVIWEEGGKYPNVVIELLSRSTAAIDQNTKKELYRNVWRVPEYYWFHPETLEFAGFRLVSGQYQEIALEAVASANTSRLWSEQLELYLGIYERQLRWFDRDGVLLPLPEDAERLAKEQAEQRAARLAAYLRSQGVDPDQLPEV